MRYAWISGVTATVFGSSIPATLRACARARGRQGCPAVPAKDMPAAEVDVDEPLVRALLAEQHPDLADRTVAVVANGWDNAHRAAWATT